MLFSKSLFKDKNGKSFRCFVVEGGSKELIVALLTQGGAKVSRTMTELKDRCRQHLLISRLNYKVDEKVTEWGWLPIDLEWVVRSCTLNCVEEFRKYRLGTRNRYSLSFDADRRRLFDQLVREGVIDEDDDTSLYSVEAVVGSEVPMATSTQTVPGETLGFPASSELSSIFASQSQPSQRSLDQSRLDRRKKDRPPAGRKKFVAEGKITSQQGFRMCVQRSESASATSMAECLPMVEQIPTSSDKYITCSSTSTKRVVSKDNETSVQQPASRKAADKTPGNQATVLRVEAKVSATKSTIHAPLQIETRTIAMDMDETAIERIAAAHPPIDTCTISIEAQEPANYLRVSALPVKVTRTIAMEQPAIKRIATTHRPYETYTTSIEAREPVNERRVSAPPARETQTITTKQPANKQIAAPSPAKKSRTVAVEEPADERTAAVPPDVAACAPVTEVESLQYARAPLSPHMLVDSATSPSYPWDEDVTMPFFACRGSTWKVSKPFRNSGVRFTTECPSPRPAEPSRDRIKLLRDRTEPSRQRTEPLRERAERSGSTDDGQVAGCSRNTTVPVVIQQKTTAQPVTEATSSEKRKRLTSEIVELSSSEDEAPRIPRPPAAEGREGSPRETGTSSRGPEIGAQRSETRPFWTQEPTLRSKQSVKRPNNMGFYNWAEKRAILEFIVRNAAYHRTKGVALWEEMEESRVCPNRSAQSLKEHYRKQLQPNIYGMPFLSQQQKHLFQKFRDYDFRKKGTPISLASAIVRDSLRISPLTLQSDSSDSSSEPSTLPPRCRSRDDQARKPAAKRPAPVPQQQTPAEPLAVRELPQMPANVSRIRRLFRQRSLTPAPSPTPTRLRQTQPSPAPGEGRPLAVAVSNSTAPRAASAAPEQTAPAVSAAAAMSMEIERCFLDAVAQPSPLRQFKRIVRRPESSDEEDALRTDDVVTVAAATREAACAVENDVTVDVPAPIAVAGGDCAAREAACAVLHDVAIDSAARKTSGAAESASAAEVVVTAGAEGGETAGAEGGETAGAEGGETAGAEGGETAGAEGGETAGAEGGETAGAEGGETAGAEGGETAGAEGGETAGAEGGGAAATPSARPVGCLGALASPARCAEGSSDDFIENSPTVSFDLRLSAKGRTPKLTTSLAKIRRSLNMKLMQSPEATACGESTNSAEQRIGIPPARRETFQFREEREPLREETSPLREVSGSLRKETTPLREEIRPLRGERGCTSPREEENPPLGDGTPPCVANTTAFGFILETSGDSTDVEGEIVNAEKLSHNLDAVVLARKLEALQSQRTKMQESPAKSKPPLSKTKEAFADLQQLLIGNEKLLQEVKVVVTRVQMPIESRHVKVADESVGMAVGARSVTPIGPCAPTGPVEQGVAEETSLLTGPAVAIVEQGIAEETSLLTGPAVTIAPVEQGVAEETSLLTGPAVTIAPVEQGVAEKTSLLTGPAVATESPMQNDVNQSVASSALKIRVRSLLELNTSMDLIRNEDGVVVKEERGSERCPSASANSDGPASVVDIVSDDDFAGDPMLHEAARLHFVKSIQQMLDVPLIEVTPDRPLSLNVVATTPELTEDRWPRAVSARCPVCGWLALHEDVQYHDKRASLALCPSCPKDGDDGGTVLDLVFWLELAVAVKDQVVGIIAAGPVAEQLFCCSPREYLFVEASRNLLLAKLWSSLRFHGTLLVAARKPPATGPSGRHPLGPAALRKNRVRSQTLPSSTEKSSPYEASEDDDVIVFLGRMLAKT